jgi:hypothetical protein
VDKISIAQIEAHMGKTLAMPGVGIEEDQITHPKLGFLYFDPRFQLIWYDPPDGNTENLAQQFSGECGTVDTRFAFSAKTIFNTIPIINEAEQLIVSQFLHRKIQFQGIFERKGTQPFNAFIVFFGYHIEGLANSGENGSICKRAKEMNTMGRMIVFRSGDTAAFKQYDQHYEDCFVHLPGCFRVL